MSLGLAIIRSSNDEQCFFGAAAIVVTSLGATDQLQGRTRNKDIDWACGADQIIPFLAGIFAWSILSFQVPCVQVPSATDVGLSVCVKGLSALA